MGGHAFTTIKWELNNEEMTIVTGGGTLMISSCRETDTARRDREPSLHDAKLLLTYSEALS